MNKIDDLCARANSLIAKMGSPEGIGAVVVELKPEGSSDLEFRPAVRFSVPGSSIAGGYIMCDSMQQAIELSLSWDSADRLTS